MTYLEFLSRVKRLRSRFGPDAVFIPAKVGLDEFPNSVETAVANEHLGAPARIRAITAEILDGILEFQATPLTEAEYQKVIAEAVLDDFIVPAYTDQLTAWLAEDVRHMKFLNATIDTQIKFALDSGEVPPRNSDEILQTAMRLQFERVLWTLFDALTTPDTKGKL